MTKTKSMTCPACLKTVSKHNIKRHLASSNCRFTVDHVALAAARAVVEVPGQLLLAAQSTVPFRILEEVAGEESPTTAKRTVARVASTLDRIVEVAHFRTVTAAYLKACPMFAHVKDPGTTLSNLAQAGRLVRVGRGEYAAPVFQAAA